MAKGRQWFPGSELGGELFAGGYPDRRAIEQVHTDAGAADFAKAEELDKEAARLKSRAGGHRAAAARRGDQAIKDFLAEFQRDETPVRIAQAKTLKEMADIAETDGKETHALVLRHRVAKLETRYGFDLVDEETAA